MSDSRLWINATNRFGEEAVSSSEAHAEQGWTRKDVYIRDLSDSLIVGYYRGRDLMYVARLRNGFVPASRQSRFPNDAVR